MAAAADPAGELSFKNVGYVGKVGVGTFKLTAQQLGWKGGAPTDGQVAFTGQEIAAAEWQQSCGRDRCLLKLSFKGGLGGICRFTGFRSADLQGLKAHLRTHFGVVVKEQPMATEGWNWVDLDLGAVGGDLDSDRDLKVSVNGKLCFDLPTSEIKQVGLGKNDVTIEFRDRPVAEPVEEILCEMCLTVPGNVAGHLSAEALRDELQKRSGLATTGSVFARFTDVQIVAPRGKHDVEFFPEGVKLRGKSQSYVVMFSNVAKLFLLETEPGKQWTFVVGVTEALRQGKTLHTFIAFSFDDSRVVPEMPDELLKEFNEVPGESCLAYRLFGLLFHKYAGKTAASPAAEFKASNPLRTDAIRCTHKAVQGHLFFLKMSFIWVSKPVIWVRWTDVQCASIDAGQLRGRSFDVQLQTKQGVAYEFSHVDTGVLQAVVDYLKSKTTVMDLERIEEKLQLRQRRSAQASSPLAARGARVARSAAAGPKGGRKDEDDDDEADEDFEDESSPEEDNSSGEVFAPDDDEDGAPANKKRRRSAAKPRAVRTT